MKAINHKLLLSLIFIMGVSLSSYAQCAMCRAALMTGDEQNTAEGINHGITYLMVFPYILVGIVAYAIYRIIKKETKQEA